jgi:hypothetical protein
VIACQHHDLRPDTGIGAGRCRQRPGGLRAPQGIHLGGEGEERVDGRRAAIDWDTAFTALASGDLPCSGGERRILQLAASLAAGTPISLRDTVTSLDDNNTARLLTAIRHAAGKRLDDSRCR